MRTQTDRHADRQTEFSSLDRVCIPFSAVKTSSLGINIAQPLPPFLPPPKTLILGHEVLKIHANINNPICLKYKRIPEISASYTIQGMGARCVLLQHPCHPINHSLLGLLCWS